MPTKTARAFCENVLHTRAIKEESCVFSERSHVLSKIEDDWLCVHDRLDTRTPDLQTAWTIRSAEYGPEHEDLRSWMILYTSPKPRTSISVILPLWRSRRCAARFRPRTGDDDHHHHHRVARKAGFDW